MLDPRRFSTSCSSAGSSYLRGTARHSISQRVTGATQSSREHDSGEPCGWALHACAFIVAASRLVLPHQHHCHHPHSTFVLHHSCSMLAHIGCQDVPHPPPGQQHIAVITTFMNVLSCMLLTRWCAHPPPDSWCSLRLAPARVYSP
jgi:hypothetical protein